MQRAIVALRKSPRLPYLDDHKKTKTVHEPMRLDDIVEELGEDNEKAESSTAASEKTRVEERRPPTEPKGPKTVIENKKENVTGSKDDAAVSIRSRHSRDTESITVVRKESILYR